MEVLTLWEVVLSTGVLVKVTLAEFFPSAPEHVGNRDKQGP